MWFDRTTPAYWPMVILLVTDVALIGVYIALEGLEHVGYFDIAPRLFDISFDQSVSEYLNQAKWVSIVILLLVFWARTRMATALGFAVVFAVVAADDILFLHETVGALLVERFGLGAIAGLRAHDTGELIVWSCLGIVVVAAFALGFRAADAAGRRVGRTLLAFLGALIFCGIGLDMLQIFFWDVGGVKQVLGLLEDGGEMVIGSVCVAYCLALVARTGAVAWQGGWPAKGILHPQRS